jgi:hypothetical protein
LIGVGGVLVLVTVAAGGKQSRKNKQGQGCNSREDVHGHSPTKLDAARSKFFAQALAVRQPLGTCSAADARGRLALASSFHGPQIKLLFSCGYVVIGRAHDVIEEFLSIARSFAENGRRHELIVRQMRQLICKIPEGFSHISQKREAPGRVN